jgi:hypothetical protein
LRKELNDANKERDKFRLLVEQRRIDNVASDRPNASPSTFARPTGGRRENALRERRCFYCDQPGHFKRDCPWLVDARNKTAQQSSDDGRFCADVNSRASAATDDTQSKTVKTLALRQLNTPTYLTARICDREISCLLDSGSDVCLFPSDVVRNFDLQPAGQSLYAANGTTVSISGYVRVLLCVGFEIFVVDGLVSEHVHEAILGANFLSENRALWDFSLGVLSLRGYNFKLCGPVARSWCRRLIIAEPVEVPARSEAVLNGYVVFSGKIAGRQPDNTAWATEPVKLADGVHVASVLVPPRATDVPVRVINRQ